MKYLIVLSCLFLMNLKTTTAQPGTKPRLNHIAVYVHNLERSSIFYKDVIGLELMEEPFKDGLHTWFTLGTQGQLHLIAGAKSDMEHFKDRHLCFSVASIDHFISNLNKLKIQFSNWKGEPGVYNIRPDGVKQIYFKDPDGYWIEINDDYQ